MKNEKRINVQCGLKEQYKQLPSEIRDQYSFDEYVAEQDSLSKIGANLKGAQTTNQLLRLTGMGVYNCDQISRLTSPKSITANYETMEGELLKIQVIYLIDSRINGVIEYDGYNGLGPYKFSYGSKSKNIMVAVDIFNRPYYCTQEQFDKIRGDDTKFILTPLPTGKTADQYFKLLFKQE